VKYRSARAAPPELMTALSLTPNVRHAGCPGATAPEHPGRRALRVSDKAMSHPVSHCVLTGPVRSKPKVCKGRRAERSDGPR